MNILLTNDDGPRAPGIEAALASLSGFAAVTVVAPREHSSGVSHAISIRKPIEIGELARAGKIYGYTVSGTPADAVKLAVKHLLPQKPDLLVSGINAGLNIGFNTFYSGTVAAAVEGAILGIPSLAVSLDVLNGGRFEPAAELLLSLVKTIVPGGFPDRIALSVNIPARLASNTPQFAVTRHSHVYLDEIYHPCAGEGGERMFILGRERIGGQPESGSDVAAVQAGVVSIAPLTPDLNACAISQEVQEWLRSAGLNLAGPQS